MRIEYLHLSLLRRHLDMKKFICASINVFKILESLQFMLLGQLNLYRDGILVGGLGFNSRQRQDFSFLHKVQTGSETHSVSYSMGIGGSFLGSEADYVWWSSISTPPYIFTASCLIKHTYNFTFTLGYSIRADCRSCGCVDLSLKCVQVNGISCN
jgi:hypothetical protein